MEPLRSRSRHASNELDAEHGVEQPKATGALVFRGNVSDVGGRDRHVGACQACDAATEQQQPKARSKGQEQRRTTRPIRACRARPPRVSSMATPMNQLGLVQTVDRLGQEPPWESGRFSSVLPITSPVSVLKAACSDSVPCLKYSNPWRSARPGDSGNTGSLRSSAWIAVFSSTLNTARVPRRVEVQTDHVGRLGFEVRSRRPRTRASHAATVNRLARRLGSWPAASQAVFIIAITAFFDSGPVISSQSIVARHRSRLSIPSTFEKNTICRVEFPARASTFAAKGRSYEALVVAMAGRKAGLGAALVRASTSEPAALAVAGCRAPGSVRAGAGELRSSAAGRCRRPRATADLPARAGRVSASGSASLDRERFCASRGLKRPSSF